MASTKLIMNTFESGFFWNNYKSIESDFLHFLEYVPFCPSNRKMYSPKLTGMLLQVGGYVDSAFKEMTRFFGIRATTFKRGSHRRSKSMLDIIDAFSVYEPIYNLSANNGGDLIAKLDFGDRRMNPFSSFSSPQYARLEWWDAYNRVKHQYSINYRKAKIDNVLEGLAGAFLLNVVHYPSIKLLWQLGVLTNGYHAQAGFQDAFLTEDQFNGYYEGALANISFLNIGIRVETPLFLYAHH